MLKNKTKQKKLQHKSNQTSNLQETQRVNKHKMSLKQCNQQNLDCGTLHGATDPDFFNKLQCKRRVVLDYLRKI